MHRDNDEKSKKPGRLSKLMEFFSKHPDAKREHAIYVPDPEQPVQSASSKPNRPTEAEPSIDRRSSIQDETWRDSVQKEFKDIQRDSKNFVIINTMDTLIDMASKSSAESFKEILSKELKDVVYSGTQLDHIKKAIDIINEMIGNRADVRSGADDKPSGPDERSAIHGRTPYKR